MVGREGSCAGPKRNRAAFCLLISLLLSSTFLFALFHVGTVARPVLGFFRETGSDSREATIKLHPEDHVRRPATTVTHHWNITKGYRRPDGVLKLVYLINGYFPGPVIEARSEDRLLIIVSNQLDDEGVSFHWHGLHMRDANNMDGVVGVTQKAIPPGAEFTYQFDISSTQAGTFWYHSHSALQRSDGLYGGLVVHKPLVDGSGEDQKFGYNEEQLLLVGDWYHYTAEKVQDSYVTFKSSGHEPVPDSLLINGLGKFNCAMGIPIHPLDCEDIQRPRIVLTSAKTRLRVINVGTLAGFNMTVSEGNMKAFQIDGGNPIVPSAAVDSIGVLYPGERVDIVVSGEQIKHVTIALDKENFVMRNPALTAVQTLPITTSKENIRTLSRDRGTASSHFDLSTARSVALVPAMPAKADQTLVIYNHLEMLARFDNVPMGFMNMTNWIPQDEPLIQVPRREWDKHQFVPEIKSSSGWVDIVINNLDDKGHPFHLHGYNFYVLVSHAFPRRAGYRTYNPFDPPKTWDERLYPEPNLVDPPLQDTLYIPRKGYVILRIRPDNLGIWLFHCHILWHHGTGMSMAFEIT